MLYLALLLATLRRALHARRDLLIENLALRQQLAVYTRQSRRPQLRHADRRFWSLLARSWSEWRSTLVLVQPDTVVRWHRTAWRRYWTWKSRGRGRGRPRIDAELRELMLRIARENPRWGAVRIVGELRALGFEVSARTVRRYRQQALRRPPSPSWHAFLGDGPAVGPQRRPGKLATIEEAVSVRGIQVLTFNDEVCSHTREGSRRWRCTRLLSRPSTLRRTEFALSTHT